MRQRSRSRAVGIALLLAACLAGPARATGSLIGEWTLVEQTYGTGSSNLVRPDDDREPVRLRFERDGGVIRATIGAGDPSHAALSWPRLLADDTRRIHVDEKRFAEAGDRVVTRYRIDPSPGDDLTLHVTEQYRVSDDGEQLIGTIRVQFRRQGSDRGSYELHRRFERSR